MSEEGEQLSSKQFSKFIINKNQNVVFLIAGPDGHQDAIKEKVSSILSLSKITFSHKMSILILVEQVYRAISIIKGRKYHR